MIHNNTVGALGSGTTIKYKGKFYILSAGHMIDHDTDKVTLSENGNYICDLKVIKVDHVKDLLLLQPTDENIVPKIYTEIATQEPLAGDELYICGNPMGIEDVLSTVRAIGYTSHFMYFIGTSYFGNSGGGIYNKEGQVVGVTSHMLPLSTLGCVISTIPPYVIHGATKLADIQIFLSEVK
jgi:S1-C subfamily serine protease